MTTSLDSPRSATALESPLLDRAHDPDGPCLENIVAGQWKADFQSDLIGYRSSARRNRVVLSWLRDALTSGKSARALLDVGCAYGNHILMMNSLMGKNQNIEYIGIDLSDHGFSFGNTFAKTIPGFSNCRFESGNIEAGLPFPNGKFDAINLSDVIEHLEDPAGCLRELMRVTKPGGTIVIVTPLKTSLFKSVAGLVNKLTFGRLYAQYYQGKNARMEDGRPIMDVHAGHDHISEMDYAELISVCKKVGLQVRSVELMPIMSGSAWFDKHPFLISAILFFEAIHDALKLPSWSHSICVCLQKPV